MYRTWTFGANGHLVPIGPLACRSAGEICRTRCLITVYVPQHCCTKEQGIRLFQGNVPAVMQNRIGCWPITPIIASTVTSDAFTSLLFASGTWPSSPTSCRLSRTQSSVLCYSLLCKFCGWDGGCIWHLLTVSLHYFDDFDYLVLHWPSMS